MLFNEMAVPVIDKLPEMISARLLVVTAPLLIVKLLVPVFKVSLAVTDPVELLRIVKGWV